MLRIFSAKLCRCPGIWILELDGVRCAIWRAAEGDDDAEDSLCVDASRSPVVDEEAMAMMMGVWRAEKVQWGTLLRSSQTSG